MITVGGELGDWSGFLERGEGVIVGLFLRDGGGGLFGVFTRGSNDSIVRKKGGVTVGTVGDGSIGSVSVTMKI